MSAPSEYTNLVEKVKAEFPNWVKRGELSREQRIAFLVTKEGLIEVAEFLKHEFGLDVVVDVCAVDNLRDGKFAISYHVTSYSNTVLSDTLVQLTVEIDRSNPATPTLIPVWNSVEYHEREQAEMYGITFEGHPNLSLLLLPEDWVGMPPMRKEYKLPQPYEEGYPQ